jgi:hypothetical protein
VFSCFQCCKHLRHMPFPRRSNVDEIEIVTRRTAFKITFTIGIDRRFLLAGIFDELSRAQTLLINDITDGVDYYFVDRHLTKNVSGQGLAITRAHQPNQMIFSLRGLTHCTPDKGEVVMRITSILVAGKCSFEVIRGGRVFAASIKGQT